MKVLHVIPSLASRTGGPPVAVVESSLALRALGIESTIFTTDMAEAASAPAHRSASGADFPAGADQLEVRMFPAHSPRRLAFSPSLFRAVRDEVRRYDLVHIHSLFLFPQFAAYANAHRRSVPHIVSPRGALDPWLRRRNPALKSLTSYVWQRRMLADAAALHLTSDEEARLTSDIAPFVPRAVVGNGIRWDIYQHLPSATAFRSKYLGGDEVPVVLYLGRLSHKKGLDVLIRAFAAVRRELPDCRLVIAGPDDEGMRRPLESLACAEGIEADVTFTGMLRGEDKLTALAAASVWVLPSRTENFGIGVVEAMAAGVPVVISDAVNIAPEIAAADAGVICRAEASEFARGITSLLLDDEGRSRLADRAREFARHYDWATIAPQLAKMYEQAAA